MLQWVKIKELFKDYKTKAIKIIYELDADIIDFSDNLKAFIDSLQKYEKAKKPL